MGSVPGNVIELGLPARSRRQGAGGWRSLSTNANGGYSALDDAIVRIVEQQQRRLQRGVLPRNVQPWLPEELFRCEQTVRERMVRLAHQGRLIRVGGARARRGYQTVGTSRWCWSYVWPAWEPAFKRGKAG